MFGKRNKPEQPRLGPGNGANGGGARPGGTASGEDEFPWARDPKAAACNFAAGNLCHNLVGWMATDGRVHAETYLATSGAIAGFAALQSLREIDPYARLNTATTSSGDKYLFGDPLTAMLINKNGADVWMRAGIAAAKAGLPAARIPNLDELFRHVTMNVGGPLEGRPSTGPEHQPALPARGLLALHWPQVAQLFDADFDDFHRRWGPVPRKWWWAVTAFGTSRPILDVKDVLDPAISLTILMESAIYGSMLTKP